MPRIREYEREQGALAEVRSSRSQISSGGTNALTELAPGLAVAAQTLHRVAEEREVSEVHTRLAKARAEWTMNMQERVSSIDPGDGSFVDKLQKDVAGYFDKAGAGLSTRAGRAAWTRGVASLSGDLIASGSGAFAQAAGARAKQNYIESLNAFRNSLLQAPGSFDSVMAQAMAQLNDPAGPHAKLKPADREQFDRMTKEQLALSAVQGQIAADPYGAQKQLKAGQWNQFLDADKTVSLLRESQTAIHAKEIEAERRRAQAERAERKAREAQLDGMIKKLYTGETGLSADEVLKANLSPAMREHLFLAIRRDSKTEDKRESIALKNDLLRRILLPEGDPNRVASVEQLVPHLSSGDINADTVGVLTGWINGRRTPEGKIENEVVDAFAKAAHRQLSTENAALGIRDPGGEMAYANWFMQFSYDYRRQRQAGKTVQELLDPKSPDYLGKSIEAFRRTPQQAVSDMMRSATGAPGAPTSAVPGAPPPARPQGDGSLANPFVLEGNTVPPEEQRQVGKVYLRNGKKVEWRGRVEGWQVR